tara:strand:- start:1059 stop:1712 length:654 start_codon:yes stop_codon:yes gene_type:complete
MRKSNEVLTRVRQALGIEVALEQRKLENGTVIEAEKFEADEPVFIVTEDEKVALPLGEYLMEDGMTLAVAEEGIISDIIEKVAEGVTEEVAEETEEVEAEAESREPKKVVESTVKESHFAEDKAMEDKEEMGYVTKEELGQAVEEIKAMIDEVKAEYIKSEDVKEEEVAELKAELSKPASKPLRHNPEGANKNREVVRFASNGQNTILNRILTKINQ